MTTTMTNYYQNYYVHIKVGSLRSKTFILPIQMFYVLNKN